MFWSIEPKSSFSTLALRFESSLEAAKDNSFWDKNVDVSSENANIDVSPLITASILLKYSDLT